MVWVEQDLASTDKPWKIIILHEPGWSCEGHSSGYSHPNNEDVQNLLQPLCEQYGVQIVFAAHNHYYARACKNGVYHITTAGGGAPLYDVEEEFPNVMNTQRVHHYCRVEIEGESMAVTAVSTYGELIDEFEVEQNNRPEHLLGFLTKQAGPGQISYVTITAGDETTYADETGYYGLELVPGYHEASFMLEGYCTVDSSVQIFEGTETTIDTMMMICTNISKFDDLGFITIYPNPVTNTAILNLNISTSTPVKIGVYNTTGTCLKSWQLQNQSIGENNYKLVISSLPPDIYFVRVQIGNEIITKKIIKVK